MATIVSGYPPAVMGRRHRFPMTDVISFCRRVAVPGAVASLCYRGLSTVSPSSQPLFCAMRTASVWVRAPVLLIAAER